MGNQTVLYFIHCVSDLDRLVPNRQECTLLLAFRFNIITHHWTSHFQVMRGFVKSRKLGPEIMCESDREKIIKIELNVL